MDIDPAVSLRCKELADVVVRKTYEKLISTTLVSAMTLDAFRLSIQTLLEEIAIGQTILSPNPRQRAEAKGRK